MLFKTHFFKDPQNDDAPGKYYPFPVYDRTVCLDELVDEISHSTSLTASDVRAVTWELIDVFRRHLVRGNKVRLDGIGIFKLSFRGTGEEKPEDVTAANIDRSSVRPTFLADAALRHSVSTRVSFSKVKGTGRGAKRDNQDDAEEDGQEG